MDFIEQTFSVSNIRFSASADTIKKKVGYLEGVKRCDVSLSTNTMTVEYDHNLLHSSDIIKAVEECGYNAWLPNQEMSAEVEDKPLKKVPLIVALLMSIVELVFFFVKVPSFLSWIPPIIVLIFSVDILFGTFQAFLEKQPKTDCVNVLAAIAAFVFAFFAKTPRYFLFASCVIFTECIASRRLIQKNRIHYAKTLEDEIQKKMPKDASVYQNYREQRNALNTLQKDQVLLVRPGETVPVDGKVIRGFALLDVSALTGYENPIEKSEGSYVYANSVCLKGSIEIKAERVGSGTAMMRFAEMAERTAGDTTFSSPFQKFTKWLLLYIALTSLICLTGWIYAGENTDIAVMIFLSILACASLPSLSIVTKNRVMKGARSAAEKHILFRSTDALELVSKTDKLIMDQDGVLTEPDLNVTDFIPVNGMSEGKLEYIAYALENRSNLPFAKAITRYLKTRKMSGVNTQEFSALSMQGRNSIRTMNRYFCGTKEEVLDRGIDLTEHIIEINELAYQGKRVLLVLEDDKLIGIVAAIRQLIPEVKESLEYLKKEDMELHVFTDGTMDETRILARNLDLENVIENPTNDEKDRILKNLANSDNIITYISGKDSSLRLQNADVTVSIGTGAKFEEDHASIILTRNRLSDFIEAIKISAHVNDSIQQSQIFVIVYHIAIILTLSFFLPQLIPVPFNIAIASIASYLCLYFSTKETK